MNVPDSVAQAIQPVDGEYGQVHQAHAVPQCGSLGEWVILNGDLQRL